MCPKGQVEWVATSRQALSTDSKKVCVEEREDQRRSGQKARGETPPGEASSDGIIRSGKMGSCHGAF